MNHNIWKNLKIKLILVGLILSSIQLPASARVKLYTACFMGGCYDNYFLSKTPVERNYLGTLYRVEEEIFPYAREGSPSSSNRERKTSYVLCSTQKPAIIFNYDNNWTATLLNPGGFVSHVRAGNYSTYWATCHNFIDTYWRELTDQARQLGYPLNLQEREVELNQPTDIFR